MCFLCICLKALQVGPKNCMMEIEKRTLEWTILPSIKINTCEKCKKHSILIWSSSQPINNFNSSKGIQQLRLSCLVLSHLFKFLISVAPSVLQNSLFAPILSLAFASSGNKICWVPNKRCLIQFTKSHFTIADPWRVKISLRIQLDIFQCQICFKGLIIHSEIGTENTIENTKSAIEMLYFVVIGLKLCRLVRPHAHR